MAVRSAPSKARSVREGPRVDRWAKQERRVCGASTSLVVTGNDAIQVLSLATGEAFVASAEERDRSDHLRRSPLRARIDVGNALDRGAAVEAASLAREHPHLKHPRPSAS